MTPLSVTDSPNPSDDAPRVAVAVLAAGHGTRMFSSIPKHLHPVGGVPIVKRIIKAGQAIHPDRLIVVVSPATADMDVRLGMPGAFETVVQDVPTGTGAAVKLALNACPDVAYIVSLLGDNPLLTGEMVEDLLAAAVRNRNRVTILSCLMPFAASYGRIDRDESGHVTAIVEAKNDDPAKRLGATEINSGIMVMDAAWAREALARLELDEQTGEYLLTDVVAMAAQEHRVGQPWPIDAVVAPAEVSVGINNRAQQADADTIVREQVRQRLMLAGVTMIGPETIFIDEAVAVGRDTTILPGTILRGSTTIGKGCEIGPYAVLTDATVGDDVSIGQATIEDSTLESHTSVGPYCRIRGGSVVKTGATIGNFAELKNTTIGARSKSMHFGYLGDATIGEGANIGAGSVTANYDGVSKHRTTIEDGAFVGSDTIMVAPVTVGKGAKTGAGSVVNRDVDSGDTVVGVPAKPLPKRT